jgi:drug/metabolite transporter (DMT)-like permease
MAYGALAAAIVAAAVGSTWSFDTSPEYLLSLAYLAVFGSVVAFVAYLTLLRRVGPGTASYVGVATPVVAMMFSTAFEAYRWTALGALGVALAIAGNWLALKPKATARAARPSPRRPS